MRKILTFTVLLLFISLKAFSAEKMTIAILDFKAEGVSKQTVRTATGMLQTEFVNTHKFIVVERTQMDEILNEQGFQQTGCTDQECAVQLGKLLSARKILIGDVSKLGPSIIMNVRIVDVEKGISEFATTEKAKNIASLDEAVRNVTEKLVREIDKKRDTAEAELGKIKGTFINAKGCFLIPVGNFGDIHDPGYGGILNITFRDVFLRNFDLGFEGGYYLFPGKKEQIDKMYMLPAFLAVSYRLNISGSFSVSPKISFGYSYNNISYDIYEFDSSAGQYITRSKTEKAFEPIGQAGLTFAYFVFNRVNFLIDTGYSMIFESGGHMDFLSFSAGIGLRL